METNQSVERGCGFRVVNGCYLETKITRFGGVPIRRFLMDPPVRVDQVELGLSPRGVKLMKDHNGVLHVWDWVGAEHYPNAADVIEELFRHGLSRRVAASVDLSGLTAASRLILVHPRGWYLQHAKLEPIVGKDWQEPDDEDVRRARCRSGVHADPLDVGHCIEILWHCLSNAEPVHGRLDRDIWEALNGREDRRVVRQMPAFSYRGFRLPNGLQKKFAPAIIAALPIGQLTVIRDPLNGKHDETVKRLSGKTGALPIRLEDC